MIGLPAVVAQAETSGTSLPEDDDENIIRDAFMKSYEEAQPCQVRIPGMQDFAAAVGASACPFPDLICAQCPFNMTLVKLVLCNPAIHSPSRIGLQLQFQRDCNVFLLILCCKLKT